MRKQDYLLDLIHSLSPPEKRHFNLYSNLQPGNKIYYKLYELLEKEKVYNAAQLSKVLKITAKKLADEKNYLQHVLLRALRNFEQDNYIPSNLLHRFLEADLLQRRGMTGYALSHLDKMFEKTVTYEQFGTYIHYVMLRHILVQNVKDPSPQFLSADLFKAQMERMQELFDLNALAREMVPYVVNRNHVAMLTEIAGRPPLNRKPDELLSLHARNVWYRSHNTINALTDAGLGGKTIAGAVMLKKLFEDNPVLIELKPEAYLQTYFVLAVCYSYAEADKAIAVLDELLAVLDYNKYHVGSKRIDLLRYDALMQKMNMLNGSYRYAETVEIGRKLMPVALREDYQHKRIVMLYLYAVALLFTGQGEKALVPLRDLLKGNNTRRLDIVLLAMALELMVQYDLGNYALIPFQVRAAQKWAERKHLPLHQLGIYFKRMLNLGQAATKGNTKEVLKEFLQDVRTRKISIEVEVLNIGHWLEQKLKVAR